MKAGGPTVKNVTGFDLCRLLVGSLGTLGVIAEVVLRTRPRPGRVAVVRGRRRRPVRAARRLFTAVVDPVGRHDDVGAARGPPGRRRRRARRAGAGSTEVEGPPPLPDGGPRSLRAQRAARASTGAFVAEVGVGVVHRPRAGRRACAATGGRRAAPAGEGGRSTRPAASTRARHGGGVRLLVDDDELAACVACGLCLPHCPTYRVTGEEAASPRGASRPCAPCTPAPRLDDEFVAFMDRCVQCRGCETACPSAVPFGRLMEGTRATLPRRRLPARLAYRVLGHHRLLLAGSTALAALAARAARPAARSACPRLPLRRRRLRRQRHRRVAVHRLRDGRVAARRPRRRGAGDRGHRRRRRAARRRGAACCGALHATPG